MLRALLILCLLTTTAHAERWYQGRHGTNRVVHVSITAGLALSYAIPLESNFAAIKCKHLCEPTSIDRSTRNALHWNNTGLPASLSNINAYIVTPVFGLVMILPQTEPTTAQIMDNVVPIGESLIVALSITRGIKLLVGRQRPYAYFDTMAPPLSTEDNLSYPSGHTTAAFATAISAGMVAHMRHLKYERYVWIGGIALAATTGYLRIAADKHYLTDVMSGAAIGTTVGLTVPLLMRREVEVMASPSGVAVAGVW